MISNPILFSHSHRVVCLLCVFTINTIVCVNVPAYKQTEIIDDLPVKKDLERYLLSLEKIIFFANSHRRCVDLNLNVGLFVSNVNLKNAFQVKGHRLLTRKRLRLERLLKMNDELQHYFNKKVREHSDQFEETDGTLIHISKLFMNDSSWSNHLKTFDIELLKKTKFYTRKQLESVYFKWPVYKSNLRKYNNNHSSASETNTCMDMLSQNPGNGNPKMGHCQVPYECARLILNGTHYGNAIADRILLLLLARYARRCALLTPEDDNHVLESLCATAYNEAEFIAYHDFELPDLFIKILCLCSFDGHAQFLRRSWLEEAMDYQSVLGCFNLTRPGSEDASKVEIAYGSFSWQLVITDLTVMGGACNVHATAVAAGILSAAVRYILETYY